MDVFMCVTITLLYSRNYNTVNHLHFNKTFKNERKKKNKCQSFSNSSKKINVKGTLPH